MGPLVESPKPPANVWETCRRALRDWYGLEVLEDPETAAQWLDVLDGLALNLEPLRPLVTFAAMLKNSDPEHTTGLVPELRVLEPFEAVSLFRNSDALEVAFGVRLQDEASPQVLGFDFDKLSHFERLSAEPDTFVSADTIEAFALGMLIDGFAPDGALLAMGEHDDLEVSLERLTAAFGAPHEYDGIWLFGGEELLVGVRWFPALGGHRVDLVALSEAACRPLSRELLGTLGFPPSVVSAHDWAAGA